LGRLTRKTLSFSKCPRNHLGCLRVFINDYNQHLAIT
ncbi:MAG: IS1 family transposase, partial [Planctomycetaceae bacterium]|nr:IS1 family transposase [Planctomycetaceae bacterium]MBA3316263.1 IS1 family transposase [Planctomycetaceae bacterium]